MSSADQHIDTTNISDLPIVTNNSGNNNEEIIQNLNLTTEQRQQDLNAVTEKVIEEKRVRFKDDINNEVEKDTNSSKKSDFVLRLEHKVIILATFFFFIFMDTKFKKYILNIMIPIFGNYLRTETNQMNAIGMFMYSLFYGSILLACVSLIDLTSFHLAF